MKPFSHKNYQRNEKRHGGFGCVFCGKYVDETAVGWVRVVEGGSRFADPDEEVDPQGDMGCWPVGKTCHKKYGPQLVFVEIEDDEEG